MRACLVGPMPDKNATTGVQEFNVVLAKSLTELGHRVEIAMPQNPLFAFDSARRAQEATGCRTFCLDGLREGSGGIFEQAAADRLAETLQRYDLIAVSGSHFAYARILRAALGVPQTLVWTHGPQISPFLHWDGAELKQPGVKLVCINHLHELEAKARGFGERAVRVDVPVPFEPVEVQAAGGFCIAVGNLEPRKRHGDTAQIAAALKKKTRVYGAAIDPKQLEIVQNSKWLDYRGSVPHRQLLDETAAADFALHPATVEGFPIALREANGRGIPAITWDIPLYRDGLDPERNILLDPRLPVDEQLAGLDWKPYRAIANRRALAAETQERYGVEVFQQRLAGLLEG